MALTDLARGLASHEDVVTAPIDANDFIRQAAEDNRRINRRNNLVLGAILLIGGLIMSGFLVVLLLDPQYRAGLLDNGAARLTTPIAGSFLVLSAVIVGAQRVWRGVRG